LCCRPICSPFFPPKIVADLLDFFPAKNCRRSARLFSGQKIVADPELCKQDI
jgi:hypothetical protein